MLHSPASSSGPPSGSSRSGDDRAAFVGKPSLILWGAKDVAFRTKELERWKSELSQCEVHVFEDCGHFVAEEAPDRVLPALQAFVR